MNEIRRVRPSVLVTGANGYIGRLLMARMAGERPRFRSVVAMDVRETPREGRRPGVTYVTADIRTPDLHRILSGSDIDTVVHLATIVTPGRRSSRDFEYSVDVLGTENVLRSCLKAGVDKIIITSSGAAYGYHPDNPEWLEEGHALRGNPEFAYSDHKRMVEETLARYRSQHAELKQLVFRPGTILGRTARNQITDLFEKPVLIGLRGADAPFVLIWDQDVVNCLMKGILEEVTGTYNLAGDGILTLREMAGLLGKPYLSLPVSLVQSALWVLKRMGLSQYGPEQVNFLRYRPVLSNRRLKETFGYDPQKTTRQVFESFVERYGAARTNGSM